MTSHPAITCPRCRSELISVDIAVNGWCARCGAIVAPPKGDETIRYSGRALASIALGVASLVGFILTAIPAIVFGVLAIRDINSRPEELKGKGLAYGGIGAGLLLGLLCAPMTGSLTLQLVSIFQSSVRSSDTETILEIADEMGVIAPAGCLPSYGRRNPVFQERYVWFVGEEEEAAQALFVYVRRDTVPAESAIATSQEKIRERNQPLPNSEPSSMTVHDVAISVQQDVRKAGGSQQEIRFCQFGHAGARVAVYWRVRDPSEEEASQRAQQFRELLESLLERAEAEEAEQAEP